MRDRTTRLVAEKGLYMPSSTPGGGGGAVDGVIFRPGGVAAGNVFTTWVTAFAAATATNDTTILYVDNSLAPAVVPTGVYDCKGALVIEPYVESLTVPSGAPSTILTLADGAVLRDLRSIEGIIKVQLTCATTSAFDFSYGPVGGPSRALVLAMGAQLVMLAGATVPAISVPGGDSFVISAIESCTLNASATPGVPVVAIGVASLFAIRADNTINILGDTVSGPVGSTMVYVRDDSVNPFVSVLFAGTLQDLKTSVVTNASSGIAALGLVATADGAGGVMWMAGGGASPWMQVGGIGGTIEQVDPTASVQMGAATPTNTSFAAYGGTASGLHSVAIGSGAVASGNGAFAFSGTTPSTASGLNSFAAGGGTATHDNDFAYGLGATATGTAAGAAIAMGQGALALGENAIAIGVNAIATGDDAFALAISQALGDGCFAQGNGLAPAGAINSLAVALGFAQGQAGMAGGEGTTGITGVFDLAWGRLSLANGSGAAGGASFGVVALSGGTSTDDATFSHGPSSTATLHRAAAFSGSTASAADTFAAGTSAATATAAFAGSDSQASGIASSAFAEGVALADSSFAASQGFTQTGVGSTALASGFATGQFSTAVSIGTTTGSFDFAAGNGSLAQGGVAIGSAAFGAGTASGDGSFAAGGTAAHDHSYKIGTDAGPFVYVNFDAAGGVQIQLGNDNVFDLEAFTTTVGATLGGANPLPATPAGYLHLQIGGTPRTIPFYNP